MSDRWKGRLVRQNDKLFVQTFRGVPFAPGYPQCGDGWREIVSRLVQRFAAASSAARFTEIREHHGFLVVIWKSLGPLLPEVELGLEQAVALATARSACTCSRCGGEGRLFSDGVRLATSCASHGKGNPVPVIAGFHDRYLLRSLVEGRSRLIRCRYDRISDAFVEVAESAGDGHASATLPLSGPAAHVAKGLH
jgi:hypothetical protein